MFQLLDLEITSKQLEEFFFSFKLYGVNQIKIKDLITEAHKLQRGKGSSVDKKIQEQALKRSMRRFGGKIEDIEQHIAREIEINNLRDFGKILKGHDYEDNDTILKSSFFQCLINNRYLTDPNKGLKEGDVLDLIAHYSSRNSNYLDLLIIKDRLDFYIKSYSHKLMLESHVKEICDENIIETDEAKQNNV